MINHLMLNLRQISNSQPDGGLEQTLTFPEPVFAANSFIGNLGAPLRENSEEIEREIDVFDGYEMHAHTKNNVRGSEHGDLGKTLHHEEEGWHCV
ncbi:hypothetical protein BD410DRAFT_113766 [Rickenella mellea]|uniref:Uncharacterized protein n=1 Tax=Rickenella mellea TaxID=50990 RepID=A0A4Y7Q979_9AGAM|nr:hypothetical protein BD410DRAFT_113766 [Rickenella mellea]